MTELTTADLQRMAREAFGRELDAEQAEGMRARLPAMVALAQLLRVEAATQSALDPAAIHVTPDTRRG